jgi:glycosyltransferase involved in cell wall biosynthesis
MAMGKPVIVSNLGWYAELPDAACIKLEPGPETEHELTNQLLALAEDRSRREAIGRRAQAYIKTECAPDRIAREYVDFAQQIIDSTCHSIG